MPFWQAIKRCQHCTFWRQIDPSAPVGTCEQQEHAKRPFWLRTPEMLHTQWDAGDDCATYLHDAHKPHPLDKAPAYMAMVQPGDTITLRTYAIGDVSRVPAKVLRYAGRNFAIVGAFNGEYRMRLRDAARGRAGTLVGMEGWGVDVEARPISPEREQYDHQRMLDTLAKLTDPGYITLNNLLDPSKRLRTRITSLTRDRVGFSIEGRNRTTMRTGPMAGVIAGELWTVDTGA